MNQQLSKICLVLCKCGHHIDDRLDLSAVAQWARDKQIADMVVEHEFLCSPKGKSYLATIITENQPDKIVIAACSPKAHDETFKQIAGQHHLNPANIHMANVREQAAWVTADKQAATEKAKMIIRAAIERVKHHDPLETKLMDVVPDLVIIGGGIAGMEAALLAAEAGRQVTIIERNIALGGRIMQSEELAPHMECTPCMLAPQLSAISENNNITVVTNAKVDDVLGFYGNFTVKVTRQPRLVNERCVGCEECFAACPVQVKSDFHLGLGDRKAIHTLYPGSVPIMAAIDRDHCLHCQGQDCRACAEACPFNAIDFKQTETKYEIPAGAVIIAVGNQAFDPLKISRLGYGQLEHVLTLPELERFLASNGPTRGQLNRFDNHQPPHIAVIHCAGSLDAKEGLPYCSGICCTLALKAGALLRKQFPQATLTNFYQRLVLPGPELEGFLEQQKRAGTQFYLVNDIQAINLKADQHQIKIYIGEQLAQVADLVILATGVMPGGEIRTMADLIHLDLKPSGFFQSDHYFLRSVQSSLDGIYVAGGCAGPGFAVDAIRQAQAAAGDAVSRLIPGRQVALESKTAEINSECCSGCRLCIAVCSYHAISYDVEKKTAVVNQAICRGCGTCVANCPSGAAWARHFTNEQITAELEALLYDQ